MDDIPVNSTPVNFLETILQHANIGNYGRGDVSLVIGEFIPPLFTTNDNEAENIRYYLHEMMETINGIVDGTADDQPDINREFLNESNEIVENVNDQSQAIEDYLNGATDNIDNIDDNIDAQL